MKIQVMLVESDGRIVDSFDATIPKHVSGLFMDAPEWRRAQKWFDGVKDVMGGKTSECVKP